MTDDIARLRCMWERQEGSMRKVPGVTSEAIESARGEIADIPLYNDSDEPQLFGETISYAPPDEKLELPVRIRTADEARAAFGAGAWQADMFRALVAPDATFGPGQAEPRDDLFRYVDNYNPFPLNVVLPTPPRFIELPTKWYGTVVEQIAIVEDHDPGDEDARSESTRRISQYARRADA